MTARDAARAAADPMPALIQLFLFYVFGRSHLSRSA
jgi:hypothetical protein